MLKQRVLTAVALIVPLLAALYFFPSAWLVPLFGIVTFLAALEWAGLCGFGRRMRVVYAAALTAVGGVLAFAMLDSPETVRVVAIVAALWWAWALIDLGRTSGLYYSRWAKAGGGFLVLVPLWGAAVFLHAADAQRPWALLFGLVLVWIADAAAYLIGGAIGRTKLAPRISPGKTVEGLAAALLAVMLLAYFCGTMIWRLEGARLGLWVGLAVAVALISVLGDLSESKLKRVAGVKDSGALLPGHGGVLDRIDALTAAVPIYAVGWLVLLHMPT